MQPVRPSIEPKTPMPAAPSAPDRVPPALAALLNMGTVQPPMMAPNPGIAGALNPMSRPLPSYQEGGMIGPGGTPVIQNMPQGQGRGLSPPGGQQTPLTPQQMQAEAQRFAQQNPEQFDEIREVINDALREGDLTMQQLQMVVQMAQVVSQQPQLYPQLRAILIRQGLFEEGDLPMEYDQGTIFTLMLLNQVVQQGGLNPQAPERQTAMSMRADQAGGVQPGPAMGGMPTVPAMQQPMAGAPSMARGGPLPVKSPNADGTVPINAHEGEYVIPADVVRRKGTEFFDKLLENSKKSGG